MLIMVIKCDVRTPCCHGWVAVSAELSPEVGGAGGGIGPEK